MAPAPATKRLVWVVPEERGGIRSYSETLWPAVAAASEDSGFEACAMLTPRIRSAGDIEASARELHAFRPDLIHVQHEFGLFGAKVPGLDRFPAWLHAVRKLMPEARVVATAHTVLDENYAYPWRRRGWQAPLRLAANGLALPLLRRHWLAGTWAELDGVIVHSALQRDPVWRAGCAQVAEIPHFVQKGGPHLPEGGPHLFEWHRVMADLDSDPALRKYPRVLVFGYITPEKGQLLAIEAMAEPGPQWVLILAGGARTKRDRSYEARCRANARRLGVEHRVKFTGFVDDKQVDSLYQRADLVLAPFLETSGSGSLAQAMARGAPTLASDLPLNRELSVREPGCVALFDPADPRDCAAQVRKWLADQSGRKSLGAAAARYAQKHGLKDTARRHLEFYAKI